MGNKRQRGSMPHKAPDNGGAMWKWAAGAVAFLIGVFTIVSLVMSMIFLPAARENAQKIAREEISIHLQRILDRLDTLVSKQDLLLLDSRVQRVDEKLQETVQRIRSIEDSLKQ
jgi:hypothetical protein